MSAPFTLALVQDICSSSYRCAVMGLRLSIQKQGVYSPRYKLRSKAWSEVKSFKTLPELNLYLDGVLDGREGVGK